MALTIQVPSNAPVVLGTSSTSIRAVANTAGFYYIVKGLILTNTSASPVTVNLFRYQNAGSATDATSLGKAIALSANQSLHIDTVITLGQGDTLTGLCSASSSVTAQVSGFGKVA